ncbi:MAG: transglycosylase SLT domain-containing protein [Burkholderiaceae bacterium]
MTGASPQVRDPSRSGVEARSDRPDGADASASSQYPDLWARLRAGFALPELPTPLVAEKERFYMANRDALNRMFTRGARYLHYIVEEVERRGLPSELALLPFVESAMNPVALSSAQAAGLWQFIPSTGKHYNLAQNWWVDNRRDVVKSTHAALDYLQRIHEMNDNDWFLALASYNWGEGAVGRAVKANRARGGNGSYLSLSMPNETRHYVPKLIALKNIILRADELGLELPRIPNRPYFVTIEKTRPIDLKLAAEYAGMSVDDFVALNPAHNRPVISASRNNLIKIPADRLEAFQAAVALHDRRHRPMASWQPYTLKQGETIDDIARRGKVSTQEIIKANGMKANARVLPGTRMLAPQPEVEDEQEVEAFQGPRIYESVTVSAVYHRVQRKESLGSIANNYGVSEAQLSAWNGGLKAVKPGASLLVRPAGQQTLLTTETGEKRLVSRLVAKIGEETREAAEATRDAVAAAGSAVLRKLPSTVPGAQQAARKAEAASGARAVKAKPSPAEPRSGAKIRQQTEPARRKAEKKI